MRQRDELEERREEARFRSAIVAAHPEKAKDILDILDTLPVEGEFAPALSEEEMEGYEPYSVEEADAAIASLRRFGMHVE